MFKSGFISIAGKPNVGKSTLLNAFLGQKIAAVSPKPQTTRSQITGVLTNENSQFVFIDTPGIHDPKNKLGKYMNNEAYQGVDGADIVLYIVAADRCNIENEQEILNKINCDNIILVINKTDAVEKESLLPLISNLQAIADFKEIVPISALKKDGTDKLLKVIEKYLEEGPKFFPEDTLTDQPERQICAEFIREKLMRNTNCEIPYGIAVVIESMKYNEEKNLTSIEAIIYCERDSHKSIIIGKNGDMLKKIGTSARHDIEKFTNSKVYLNLWVKVKENWRNSEVSLKNFGYKENNWEIAIFFLCIVLYHYSKYTSIQYFERVVKLLQDFIWNFFKKTGNITTYLEYRNINYYTDKLGESRNNENANCKRSDY